jgi:MatE
VRIEARLFRDILRVGLISAVGTIQPNLTVVVVTGVVGLFGADALAGYGIASRLDYVLIPIMFGFGTGVVTMVGINMGAGDPGRAKRVASTGALLGFVVAEVTGVVVAIVPTLWLHLFSHDQGVIAIGSLYLRIVAPVYGAVGAAMLLYFAAQGGGRVLWPFLGGTARLFVAAGVGWWAVARWGFGLPTLFALVAAAIVISAAVSLVATLSGAIGAPGPSSRVTPSPDQLAVFQGASEVPLSGVLPTLVNRLEAIAVGIENVRGIVARIVIQARPGLAVVSRPSPHRGVVEPIYLVLAVGDKADMCSPGVRVALS